MSISILCRSILSESETNESEEDLQNNKFNELGEGKELFRTLIVTKFIFDSSKKELEMINRLIGHYELEKNKNNINEQHSNINKMTKTGKEGIQNKHESEGHGHALIGGPNTQINDYGNYSALGYSNDDFENENHLIHEFLRRVNDTDTIEMKRILELKRIVGKRLMIINGILDSLNLKKKIVNFIDDKEREIGSKPNITEAVDSGKVHNNQLILVGKSVGEDKDPSTQRILNTEPKLNLSKKKKIHKIQKTKESQDSDLESESSEEQDTGVHYRKVLERKVNIDRQKFRQMCFEFIRREMRRIRNIIRIQNERLKSSRNPNRFNSISMGFSESLVSLLRKNKQDLPPDIKESLVKIMPTNLLKELGNEIYIEDELKRLERMRDLEEKERKRKEAENKKNLKKKYKREEFGVDESLLARHEADKIAQLQAILNNKDKDDVGETDENIMKALEIINEGHISDDSKMRLLQSGLDYRDGKMMIIDKEGNEHDAQGLIESRKIPILNSMRSIGEFDRLRRDASNENINKEQILSKKYFI